MMSGKQTKYIIDTLIIFLNISNSYSIIPYLLFFQYKRGINTVIIILINLLYLLVRYNKIQIPFRHPLFVIYFILNLINVYSSVVTNTAPVMPIVYLVCNTLFYIILYNCYLSYKRVYEIKKNIWLISRGYALICIICSFSIIALFSLIQLGVSPYLNLVNNSMDLFDTNVNTLGHTYYYPYHISVILVSSRISLKIPFFHEYGTICGIFHEPHIVTFMLSPMFFFAWTYLKNYLQRTIVALLYVFIVLISCSTTNVLSILFCVIIYMLYTKTGRLTVIPVVWLIFSVVFVIGLENTDFAFVANKLEGNDGSMEYSQTAIEYAFKPSTLFGYNFLSTAYITEITTQPKDVGYIPCFLNILFLTIAYYKLGKCFFTRNIYQVSLSCGILYFFLHSMKIAMVSYSLSFFIYIIFLLELLSSNKITSCNK